MRSNPLDNTREPDARGPVVVALAAVFVLGVAGVAAQWITTERRIANIRVELAERGLGRAEVRAIRGDECWRAREGFTWRTATATGVACAGPGSEVAIRETRAL